MARPSDWDEVFSMKDPTPGDTYDIDQVARRWGRVADSAEYAETKLRGLLGDETVATWIGQAGEAFRERSSKLPGQLEKAKNSYRQASEALEWWSGRLGDHQHDADNALVKGRQAKQELEAARAQLASASTSLDAVAGNDALKPYSDGSGPPPSEDDVKAARGRLDAAKAAESQAQGLVQNAQAKLDAARALAEQAGDLRKRDGRTAADKIHDAADAGIKPRSRWQKFKDGVAAAWDVIIKIAKVVVAVLGVVALIIGGPLAWVVFAAALLVLADTLMKYMKGQASLLDVLLSAVDCIPGGKGLTTLSALSKAFKSGGTLKAGLHILSAGKSAITGMAKSLRALRPGSLGHLPGVQPLEFGPLGVGKRFGPINPGPLPDHLANTFRSASYTAVDVTEPTTLYRVFSGNKELGGFWTRTKPSGPMQAQFDLALNPDWGNTAENLVEISVPPGATFFEGHAAPQTLAGGGELPGGGNQVVFDGPVVDESWITGRGYD
jgi:hypothetical protein